MRADAYGRLVLDCRDGSQQLAEWQSWGFAYVDEEFPSELEGSLNAARLIAVGDVIPHQPIEDALCSFGSGDEGRSWTSLDLLNRATEDDLLVANLETPLGDEPRQAEGAHPHVAQPSKWVTTKSGATGFVCYSLGNFAASQMDPRTVLGLMVELDARVTVAKKGHAAPKATLSSVRVVPTVCHVDGQSSVCVQRLSEYTDQQAASHWLNGTSARAVTLDALRQQWVDLQR